MGGVDEEHLPSGWAGELACLFQRLRMTSGVDSITGKPLSLRQIAKRSGYVPSHVRDVINGVGRPSRDAVLAVAGALSASKEDHRQAAFYAEQLQRAPVERGGDTGQARRSRAVRPVPRELPHDVCWFTGRGPEITRLEHLSSVDSSTGGTVVISAIDGTAGVGKTALAVHFAHRVADRFPDGQLHVNLRGFDVRQPPVAPDVVLDQFLRSLGIDPTQIPSDLDERARLYRSVLADRRVLLLLDNAATAEQIRPLLPGSCTCLALITSRNKLSGLVARDGAHRLTLDDLNDSEAVTLLARIAGHTRIATESRAAAELARLAGRLPLALRIVAERLAGRPYLRVADLVEELSDEHNRLDVLLADGDERTAVRAVFSSSYRCLLPPAARLFRLLGLHPGPDFSASAAAALVAGRTAETSPLLDALTAANLLEQTAGGRYRFHDLLRVYAAERAMADESEHERAQALRRLHNWYLHTADAAARGLKIQTRYAPLDSPDLTVRPLIFDNQAAAMQWYEAERNNVIAVIGQAEKSNDHATAWRLPLALTYYFYLRQYWQDWIATHRVAVSAARHSTDPRAQLWAHSMLGIAYQDAGQFDDALDHLGEALARSRTMGDRWAEAGMLAFLGRTYLGLQQIEPALDHAQRAVALTEEVNEPWVRGTALGYLGNIYQQQRRYEDALDILERLSMVWADTGIHHGRAYCLSRFGEICHSLARYDDAIKYSRQALTIHREIGDRRGQAVTLNCLGEALRDTGALDQARRSLSEALDLFEIIGDPRKDEVSTKLRRLNSANVAAAGPVQIAPDRPIKDDTSGGGPGLG